MKKHPTILKKIKKQGSLWISGRSLEKYVVFRQPAAVFEPHLPESHIEPLKKASPHMQLLSSYAEDVEWLANQNNTISHIDEIHKKYTYLLYEKGLSRYSGVFNMPEVVGAFCTHYSLKTLTLLDLGTDQHMILESVTQFIERYETRAMPPLLHFLFIRFLGCETLQQFFELPTIRPPFGSGPWPCLNPVCEHFNTNSITTVKLDLAFRWYTRPPIGKFMCSCGYIYSRRGPDRDERDKFRKDGVVSYGHIWKNTLVNYWNDSTLTINEVAALLGETPQELLLTAKSLGLKLPRGAVQI